MNLSLLLFLIGILGFILNRKNIILMIIAIEIMLLAVTLLILISSFSFDDGLGQTFSIFIISIAGAESVIGLSILVAFYRSSLINLIMVFGFSAITYIKGTLRSEGKKFTFLFRDRVHKNPATILKIVRAEHVKPSWLGYGVFVNHKFYATWSGMDKSVREKQYIYTKSLTIQIVNKKLSIIEINTICKAIIVHGQLLPSTG
jgi:NADH-ubiquinone oxidoreductase chain 4L